MGKIGPYLFGKHGRLFFFTVVLEKDTWWETFNEILTKSFLSTVISEESP